VKRAAHGRYDAVSFEEQMTAMQELITQGKVSSPYSRVAASRVRVGACAYGSLTLRGDGGYVDSRLRP